MQHTDTIQYTDIMQKIGYHSAEKTLEKLIVSYPGAIKLFERGSILHMSYNKANVTKLVPVITSWERSLKHAGWKVVRKSTRTQPIKVWMRSRMGGLYPCAGVYTPAHVVRTREHKNTTVGFANFTPALVHDIANLNLDPATYDPATCDPATHDPVNFTLDLPVYEPATYDLTLDLTLDPTLDLTLDPLTYDPTIFLHPLEF
jgi:hypothetical protein